MKKTGRAILAALLAAPLLTGSAAGAAGDEDTAALARDRRAVRTFDACGGRAAALSGPQREAAEKACRRELALSRLVKAADLWKAYQDDPIAAEERYGGRLLAVRGVLTGVGDSPLGFPEAVFALDGFGVRGVRCRFPEKARSLLNGLEKGRPHTFGGICKGLFRDVVVRVDHCEFY